jgi:hypothetical protein
MISCKESMSKPISSFSLLRSSIVHCVRFASRISYSLMK